MVVESSRGRDGGCLRTDSRRDCSYEGRLFLLTKKLNNLTYHTPFSQDLAQPPLHSNPPSSIIKGILCKPDHGSPYFNHMFTSQGSTLTQSIPQSVMSRRTNSNPTSTIGHKDNHRSAHTPSPPNLLTDGTPPVLEYDAVDSSLAPLPTLVELPLVSVRESKELGLLSSLSVNSLRDVFSSRSYNYGRGVSVWRHHSDAHYSVSA